MPKKLSTAKYMFEAQLNYLVDAEYPQIYLLADCSMEGVLAHTNEGMQNFAIQASAVKNFTISDFGLTFESRFSGVIMDINLPWSSIVGVYPANFPITGIPNIHDVWGIDQIMKSFMEAQEEPKAKEPVQAEPVAKTRPKLRLVD